MIISNMIARVDFAVIVSLHIAITSPYILVKIIFA